MNHFFSLPDKATSVDISLTRGCFGFRELFLLFLLIDIRGLSSGQVASFSSFVLSGMDFISESQYSSIEDVDRLMRSCWEGW